MITYPVVQHESISCVPPQMKVSPPQWPPKMKTPESPLLSLESFAVTWRRCRRWHVRCWWSARFRTVPRATWPGARGTSTSCWRRTSPETTPRPSTTPCRARRSSTSPTPSEISPSPESRWTTRSVRRDDHVIAWELHLSCGLWGRAFKGSF